MQTPLDSLIACGTKLWLDSVDPAWSPRRPLGATRAFPIRSSLELLQSGRFDPAVGPSDGRGPRRRADCLADDRSAGAQRPGRISGGLATDGGKRRVRQFRGRPAPGRSGTRSAACRAGAAVRRAGEVLGRRPRQPPDQGAGDPCRPGFAGTTRVVRNQRQRHAHLHGSPVSAGAARRCGEVPTTYQPRPFQSVYSIFVSRVDTYTERHVRNYPPPHRDESVS